MDDTMAPPLKRRKLSDPESSPDRALAQGQHDVHVHPVHVNLQDTVYVPSLPSPLPIHVEEVHITIANVAPTAVVHQGLRVRDNSDILALASSQGAIASGLVSTLTSAIEAPLTSSGGALGVLQSAVASSSSSLLSSSDSSTTDAPLTGAAVSATSYSSGESSSTPSPTPDISGASNSSSIANSTIPASSTLVPSLNATSYSSHITNTISSMTRSSFAYTSQITSRPSVNTTSPVLFYVTLADGSVATFTEGRYPFTTTLANGEVITIPGTSDATSTSTSDGDLSAASGTDGPTSATDSPAHSTTHATANAGAGAAGGYGYGSPSSTSSVAAAPTNDPPAPIAPPGVIAGGVVGGAAGLAVIVFIAMLFMRYYRRKNEHGHRQLTPGAMPSEYHDDPSRSRPGMAERAGLMPLAGAAAAAIPALFRHQQAERSNRALDASAEGSPTSERGFTRVAGRKLPSHFSPGMSSEDVVPSAETPLTGSPATLRTGAAALAGTYASPSPASPPQQHRSTAPPYRNPFRDTADSSNFLYHSPPGPNTFDDEPATDASHIHGPISPRGAGEVMTMVDGPRRQPTLHKGGPYNLTPAGSEAAFDHHPDQGPLVDASAPPMPDPPPPIAARASFLAPSLAGSSMYGESSAGGGGSNRNSRFTEEMS